MTKYDMKLTKHAVVFGGSGGIGVTAVRALVASGVKKITFSYGRNVTVADTLAAELKKKKVKVYYASVKPSDKMAVNAFLEDAVTAQGEEINHMVYAIGISPNKAYLKQTLETTGPGDDIGAREIFEINAFGSDVCCRAVAERMKQKKVKGTIAIITSTNGVNSYSKISAHYDASKAAQIMYTRIAAEYYAPFGIRINGVAPGWINTEMNKTLPPAERKKETKRIISGRWAEPEEIAALIVYLLSEASSYICGQNIMADGCYRA
jgi:3-oxoacyl-[acyl-carrier protein] reductase